MDFQGAPKPPQGESSHPVSPPNSAAGFPNPLFYNENGIRSGWRILIYLSLGLLLYALELIPVSFFYKIDKPFSVSAIILGEVMMFTAAFGAALIMSRLEDRPSGVYGLPLKSAFGKRFWQGLLIGLCEISLIVGMMAAFRAYSFGSLSYHSLKMVQWGLLWVIAAVLIGFSEEFLFRGYMQYTLAEGIGFWPAAVILSLLFAGVHQTNPGENWVGVANIFCTGLVWAFALRRTGSLWLAVGWHAAFDFGESFLYSVPNSGGVFEGHLSNATVGHGRAWLTGGDVGPEASVTAFLTLGLGALLIHFWFPAMQKEQTTPDESQA